MLGRYHCAETFGLYLDSALSVAPVKVFLFLAVFLLAMPPLSTLFMGVQLLSCGVFFAASVAGPGQPTRPVGVRAFVTCCGQKPGQRVHRDRVPPVSGSPEHGVHNLGSHARRTGPTPHVQADEITVPGPQDHHPHPIGRRHPHTHLLHRAVHLLPLTFGPGPGVYAPAAALCMPPTAHPRK